LKCCQLSGAVSSPLACTQVAPGGGCPLVP
jgi:hypothetical protein